MRFPTGNAAALPLVLVVHGADGDPSRLAPLLDVWTQAGYVVAGMSLGGMTVYGLISHTVARTGASGPRS